MSRLGSLGLWCVPGVVLLVILLLSLRQSSDRHGGDKNGGRKENASFHGMEWERNQEGCAGLVLTVSIGKPLSVSFACFASVIAALTRAVACGDGRLLQ